MRALILNFPPAKFSTARPELDCGRLSGRPRHFDRPIMKTLTASTADPGPVTVHANLGDIAELYVAASAAAISDPLQLAGLGDHARIAIVTTVGAQRRLLAALGRDIGEKR
jgi:hypothetical protein